MSAIEHVQIGIGHNIRELAKPPGQWSNRKGSAVAEVKDDELPREGDEEDLSPQRGEAHSRGKERERRERRGGCRCRYLLLQPLQVGHIPCTAVHPVLLQRDVGVLPGNGGEEEATEADRAEVPGVEGVAAEAGEVLGRGVEHPEDARGVARLPDAQQRGPVDGGEEPAGAVVDPAEVLHPSAGARRDAARLVEVEPVEHGPRAGVPDGDAAVAVPRGEAERAAFVVVVVEGGRGGGRPADGGDEGGEGGGGHGEHAEELHGARVGHDDAAPGAVRQEARGAEVDAAAVAAPRRAREHHRRGAAAGARRIAVRSRRRRGRRRRGGRHRVEGCRREERGGDGGPQRSRSLSDLVADHHFRLGIEQGSLVTLLGRSSSPVEGGRKGAGKEDSYGLSVTRSAPPRRSDLTRCN